MTTAPKGKVTPTIYLTLLDKYVPAAANGNVATPDVDSVTTAADGQRDDNGQPPDNTSEQKRNRVDNKKRSIAIV